MNHVGHVRDVRFSSGNGIDGEGEKRIVADRVWGRREWADREGRVAGAIMGAGGSRSAVTMASRWGRRVLRSYSSSFFIVTRFLPPGKRADVEMIYAAVRYPDEIVDTFDLTEAEKRDELRAWRDYFTSSRSHPGIQHSVKDGIPVTISGFRDVATRNGIPDQYYLAFLDAMTSDVSPSRFFDWDALIEEYIYGSATVVGYFLAHVYRPSTGTTMRECLESSRALAIALQLTNFARDVADDAARGRCYLPSECTDQAGRELRELILSGDVNATIQAKHELAMEAAKWYEVAERGIGSFSEDSRVAIVACHQLYSRLNDKILNSDDPSERTSLSVFEKLSVLPASKFWRIPTALVFER